MSATLSQEVSMAQASRKMTVSEFTRAPDAALQQARDGRLVEVTARGKVVAEISPPRRARLGCMEGTGTVAGDIISPLDWGID